MAFEPENLGLSATGLPLLRDLIHERTGLFYDNGRYDTLADRLAPLVIERGFHTFLDFYYLLRYDEPEAANEWRRVMDALSVQETYFWREIDQIKGMAGTILPALLRATGDKPVQIWSVPCATGEEPLTIAMVLNEAGWFERAQITIHASDGSRSAIDKARQRPLPRTRVPFPATVAARQVLHAAGIRMAGSGTPARACGHVERRQSRRPGRMRRRTPAARSFFAGTRSSIFHQRASSRSSRRSPTGCRRPGICSSARPNPC